jgi:hypothetical protein
MYTGGILSPSGRKDLQNTEGIGREADEANAGVRISDNDSALGARVKPRLGNSNQASLCSK